VTVRSLCAIAVTLVALIGAKASAQGDPLQDRLDKAIAVYNESVEKETESLAEYIKGKLATAQGRGDLELKKSFEAAEASLQRGEMPTLQLLRGTVEQAKRDLTRAKNKLLSEYRDVERDYVRQGNDTRAEAVRRESGQLDKQLADHVVARTQRPKPKAVIPIDAVKWPNTGHHYKLFKTAEPISWTESQRRCRDVGGQLACGESKEELAFLFELKGTAMIWLGATRLKDGKWQWLTGPEAPHATSWIEGRDFMATTQQAQPSARIARKDDEGWCRGYICEWDE